MRALIMQLDPRSTRLLLWLSLTLLVTAFLLYGIKPEVMRYQKTHQSLAALEALTDDRSQVEESINQARLGIDELNKRLMGDVQHLPIGQMESYFIGRLQGTSWDAGVALQSVKPGLATVVLGFQEIAFEIELRGTYKQLYLWLEELGSQLGFVVVQKFDIKPIGNRSDAGELLMSLTIVFYREG